MAKNAKFDAANMWDDLDSGNVSASAEKAAASEKKGDTVKTPAQKDTPAAKDVKKEPVQSKTQPVKDVAVVREVASDTKVNEVTNDDDMRQAIRDELESTVGHKGMKLKKLIFCVTDEIYEYVDIESRRRGISRRVFVNEIIKKYKDSPEGRAKID